MRCKRPAAGSGGILEVASYDLAGRMRVHEHQVISENLGLDRASQSRIEQPWAMK